MEEVKMEINDNVMTIEGEFDLELDLSTIHWGFPSEDKESFKFDKVPFEIKPYGEINIKYLPALAEWLYKNSQIESKKPSEWPRWRVTFERL